MGRVSSLAKVPYGRDLLENYGVITGTPENCARLMQNEEHILVFPGGARAAFKRAGEEHQLIWKQRTGFARMAVANKYPITPFFVYGADLGYDILWEVRQRVEAVVLQLMQQSIDYLEKKRPDRRA